MFFDYHKMSIPEHNFDRFIAANEPPMLVVGAGMSFGLVPSPGELIAARIEFANKLLQDDYGLGPIDVDLEHPKALFIWADKFMTALAVHCPRQEKRIIAKVLGLLTDTCWTAKVGIDLSGSAPRHRVVARFAKEKMWRSIWSLNWDSILESALEEVGLERKSGLGNQGWPTAYSTNILSSDMRHNSPNHIVDICKPHGCVNSLFDAEQEYSEGNVSKAEALWSRLMIGEAELQVVRINEHDDAFFARFRDHALSGPLVSIGWSASEPSLRKIIDESVKPKAGTELVEELIIIDPYFNTDGHTEILAAYGLAKQQVHCEVSKTNDGYTTDKLLLWLQARYTLLKIHEHAVDDWKPAVRSMLGSTNGGQLTDFLTSFADDFLPAWVRLCWRAGVVDLPPGIEPESLYLEKQNHHIPLRGLETSRDDLKATAGIVAMFAGEEQQADWDLSQFPGCFWSRSSQRLIVPIPCWAQPSDINCLRSFRAMLKRVQRDAGLISKVALMPITRNPVDVVNPDWIRKYKEVVSSYFRVPALADPAAWKVVSSIRTEVADPI